MLQYLIQTLAWNAKFVTKLPKHEIGQAAVNFLRRNGVDTSGIVRGEERIGIYCLRKGPSHRYSKVIYDRANSAIAMATSENFNWDKIFDGVEWFHFTGITPALNDSVAEVCLAACKKAKENGITVSFDLNYRKNLWSSQKANVNNFIKVGVVCLEVNKCAVSQLKWIR